jgi:hypothetical protein
MRALAGIVIGTLALSSPAYAQVEDLKLGTWTGAFTRINPVNGNRQTQPARLEVTVAPDPHWRWRDGPRQLRGALFTANQQAGGAVEPGDLALEGDVLTFAFTHATLGLHRRCSLKRQNDGSFEGTCGEMDGWRLMLTPPDDAPPPAAKPPVQ